jgi:RNA polymerase sigma-32 factor
VKYSIAELCRREDQETELARCDELQHRREWLTGALSQLAPRAQEIVRDRYLQEEPVSLAILAARYGLTPERVRQIEGRAIEKLRALMRRPAVETQPETMRRAA